LPRGAEHSGRIGRKADDRSLKLFLPGFQMLCVYARGRSRINDLPAGRLLRDAKLYEIGAGTSEIRRMLIGREIYEKTR
jgi:isovaleryl-CoA dehydrogenase